MKKVGSQNNYGFGRSIKFAAKQALEDHYGAGRFSTKATTRQRLVSFWAFLRERGIRCASQIEME